MSAYVTADGLPGIALSEWASGRVPHVSMGERDLRLAERLRGRGGDSRVDVLPGEGGVLVTTTGAVGLIRFTGFEVRIDPKLPGGHVQLFRLIEFAEGLDGLVQLAGSPHMRASDTNLLDFIVELLAFATDRIIVGGLRADYVEHEDTLPALRGRLLPDRQHLERFGVYDRVVCRYDEHEHDIADNQLLALALSRGARIATSPRVRRRTRGLAGLLEEICDPRALEPIPSPAEFSYNRQNEHYRTAHALAWLVLGQTGPDEALQTGQPQMRSFLIDMSAVFERFLERSLALALADTQTSLVAQRSDSIFWRPDRAAKYARVRPDLLVQSSLRTQARLPIDAKYKRYDLRSVDVSDLTQVFVYAYAYRDPRITDRAPAALLMYPSESAGQPSVMPLEVHSVHERLIDAALTIVGVHIPSVLDDAAAGGGPSLSALMNLILARLPPPNLAPASGHRG